MSSITIPVFIFGSIVSLLIGSIVHLIGGGKLLRLILSMVFAWIGFWIGNYGADYFGIVILEYGPVDYAVAMVSSLIFAVFGFWISGENRRED